MLGNIVDGIEQCGQQSIDSVQCCCHQPEQIVHCFSVQYTVINVRGYFEMLNQEFVHVLGFVELTK